MTLQYSQSVFPDRHRRFIYPTKVDQEELFLSFFFLLQVCMFPTDILLSNFFYKMPRAICQLHELEFIRGYSYSGGPGHQDALFPSTLGPGPLPSSHSLPGIQDVINARIGPKILARREFRQEVSAIFPRARLDSADSLSPVLQSPGHLPVSVAAADETSPTIFN